MGCTIPESDLTGKSDGAPYSQLHRRLLFHWTGPRHEKTPDVVVPRPIKNRKDRESYLDLLESILQAGLRFSEPRSEQTEWIIKDEIRATHPMLCFSEWGVAESAAHSGRYGLMGLGFTRKFVMRSGGRPVVYVPNSRSDPFRKSIIELIRAAQNSEIATEKLRRHAGLLASYLKAYHFKRVTTGRSKDGKRKPKKGNEKPRSSTHDNHLRLDFGGIFENLEDREWRILHPSVENHPEPLSFDPGNLAMIVFPDHQTLSLATQRDTIVNWIRRAEQPSVCLISREMIMSI